MIVGRWLLAPRHPLEPREQPGHAEETEDQEKRAPAIPAHQDAAKEQAEGGSRIKARDDDGIGEPALSFREIPGEDFGVGRVNDGFANSKNEARGEQKRKARGKPGGGSGHGPDKEPGGEHPLDVEMIDQPACSDLEESVAVKEGGKQNAELQVG